MSERDIAVGDKSLSIGLESIPHEIIKYGFEFEIDIPKVWELEAPVVTLKMADLDWHFDITPWDYDGEALKIGPREVLSEPEKYSQHYKRIKNADTSYAIDISFNNGRWVIVDGLHRLCKIVLNNPASENINVRIHSREAIISCMDTNLTSANILQYYGKKKPAIISTLYSRDQERPERLNKLAEAVVFDENSHLNVGSPVRYINLLEIGYSQDFQEQAACKVAFTDPFPVLSDEGRHFVDEVIRALSSNANEQPLNELEGIAYRSRFIKELAESTRLTNYLSSAFDCPITPYIRKHFLAAVNIGNYVEKAPVRRWHVDYQSLNLIVFLDDPNRNKGGDLLIFKGTREEAKEIIARGEELPKDKIHCVKRPAAGYGLLIQGSLVHHMVTPLQKGDQVRKTMVLGYKSTNLKSVFEHSGVAPDDPMCAYPEAVQQTAFDLAMRLLNFSRMEIFSNDPKEMARRFEEQLTETSEFISALDKMEPK